MTAIQNVHFYWAQSASVDKEVVAKFFKQFSNEGESLSIRPIGQPQFSSLSDVWNNLRDNSRARWWKGKCGRFFVIAPFVYDGLELVGGGMAAIEIGERPRKHYETLYDLSFDTDGVIVNPPGLELPEKRYALHGFTEFDAPNFDEETLRFWANGSNGCLCLSTDHENLCIVAPVSRDECENAIYFTLEARGGGEQSPK